MAKASRGGKAPIFVIQRHDARRLHYDFRLERDGALASWAVPKGVPLEPGTQHLAVHVEDHPLSYGSFEGEIPAGNYGAGTVEIWDRGTYELVEEKPNGGLTVHLHGERLEGLWTLVPAKLGGDPKNWLLVKKKEDDAPSAKRRGYWPMLATLAADVPTGEGWLFEVKWDGFRAIATIRGGDVDLRSRNDKSFVDRFPTVVRTLERALRTPDCVLDGEVVAVGAGRPRDVLRDAAGQGGHDVPLRRVRPARGGGNAADRPAADRAARAARGDRRHAPARHPDLGDIRRRPGALRGRPAAALRGDHGEAAPIRRYEPGRRSRNWLKIKTQGRQELVIAGYTKGQGRRADAFGALVLGVYENGVLRWAGNVGTGFDDAEIKRLLARLKPLRRDDSPFAEVPKMPKVRKGDVVWVEPELVAEVRFAEWTHDGRLRAPVYEGLREDKEADEVQRERATIEPELEEGQARPEAVEPGQAVLAGRGDHEGRPARLLPRHRAGARAAPEGPAVHDEALPGRLAGQVLLPEGCAEAHAGVDPDGAVRGVDARQAAAAAR